jgi:hypothetical protein
VNELGKIYVQSEGLISEDFVYARFLERSRRPHVKSLV